jgi:general secretion pathway protein H
MPTSARGTRSCAPPRRGGFTLIELLVVLAIMGVLAGAATLLALPGDDGRARAEARRLAALLESAMRESRATGHAIAWSAERDRYAFWRRGEDADWVPYPPHSPYRPRALAERIALAAVRVDGRELARGERVVFAPQGLRRPVSATVASADAWFTIEGDLIGRVTLERVHAR